MVQSRAGGVLLKPILLVDDAANVLTALQHQLRRHDDIETAQDARMRLANLGRGNVAAIVAGMGSLH